MVHLVAQPDDANTKFIVQHNKIYVISLYWMVSTKIIIHTAINSIALHNPVCKVVYIHSTVVYIDITQQLQQSYLHTAYQC